MSKGIVVALIVVVVVVVLAAAWIGISYAVFGHGGQLATEQRQVSDFTAVTVHGSGTLIITQGSTPSLMIEAPARVLKRVTATVSGGTLTIDEGGKWFAPWTFGAGNGVTYHLTVTGMTRIEANGSTDVRSQGALVADTLDLSTSGSGDVTLELKVQTLNVRTSGSSDVSLSGTTDALTFTSSGSSGFQARGLQSRVATIDCSGSSDVEVSVSEQLDVKVSGSADVSYAGDPKVNSTISGSGDVHHIGE
jgi:hypothetical protein